MDTTKEFPAMYRHIEKVRAAVPQNILFTTITLPFDYWMYEHKRIRGKRVGECGYSWPDHLNRWCTSKKMEMSNRHLKKREPFIEYQGIAADEADRALNKRTARENVRHPLIEWGVAEAQALQYCYDKGFDWGGLYEQFSRVSCWCCPLSRIGELRTLHDNYPELWQELEEMDSRTEMRKFRADYSVAELKTKFMKV